MEAASPSHLSLFAQHLPAVGSKIPSLTVPSEMEFVFWWVVVCALAHSVVRAEAFLVGSCIGPREAFERYLKSEDRTALNAIIVELFDGSNRNEVLEAIDEFLSTRLTVRQWHTIRPEVELYQRTHTECSPYAQILPPRFYKPLAQAVRRAEANGASQPSIKFLVDDYIDRIVLSRDFLREVVTAQHQKPAFPIVDRRDLKDLDVFSKSDPICVVYLTSGAARGSTRTVEIGRTECVMNCLNPEWAKTFLVDYFFEEVQKVRFEVYDVDSKSRNLKDHDFIGQVETSLGEIVGSPGSTKWLTLQGTGKCGSLKVVAEEADETTKEILILKCRGVKLDKKDFFGKSDPFLNIYRINDDGSRVLAHRTEFIKRTLNPKWVPFEINLRQLCFGDRTRKFRIECFDYDNDGGHDLIGTCETTCDRLVFQEDQEIPLINQKKKDKKGKRYKNSGTLVFEVARTKRYFSFLEYITGGTRLDFAVAVDFTASNGQVNDPRSLHYIGSSLNEYQMAIRAIADICAPYNPSQVFEAMGFGAIVRGTRTVNHCFPLNLSHDNFNVQGVDGLMSAYSHCQSGCQLYGPTNFSPVILKMLDKVSRFPLDGSRYQVLLIVTDGVICDFDQTVSAIITASHHPLSIIIIGVGQEDFTKMDELDSDDQLLSLNGRTASRDIVQFVPLREFLGKFGLNGAYGPTAMARLAKEVLAEVPDQVTSYMNSVNIEPKRKEQLQTPLNDPNQQPVNATHVGSPNLQYPDLARMHIASQPPTAPPVESGL
uniref:Copine-3 n=1 Tax=Steinernema glaseri TaxID=37863 RepID=A0A1I7ZW41_9BILA